MKNIDKKGLPQNVNAVVHLTARMAKMEKQLFYYRILGSVLVLVIAGFITLGFVKDEPKYLRVRGITVTDAAGKARILIGAPNQTEGRKRKDANTATMVVLGPDGADRVIIGEAPNPLIHGKVYPRIAPAYGMTIHDKTGQERGGFNFLDNGRAVMALDRKNQDAVAMLVNDVSGFAGITMNYDKPFPQYKEAFRIGTKADTAWLQVLDTAQNERVSLRVFGKPAPKLVLSEGK